MQLSIQLTWATLSTALPTSLSLALNVTWLIVGMSKQNSNEFKRVCPIPAFKAPKAKRVLVS